MRARIRTIQREFKDRTVRYQVEITGHKIVRHTPYDKQKVFLLAPYMDLMETSTLSEAFHNDMLQYADYEGVSYWQNPSNPGNVEVTNFTYLKSDGTYRTMSQDEYQGAYSVDNVLGIIFDEDMSLINIKDTIIQNTPMNAQGLYFNTWLTAHAQYCQDFTEKCCILTLN